jgi:hypothetical protein
MSDEVVPLPAHLLDDACPGSKWGQHLTTCAAAREWWDLPYDQRPGYFKGCSMRLVTWKFPVEIGAEARVTVKVDPFEYISRHLDDYIAFEVEDGEPPWMKPMAFLRGRVYDQLAEEIWTRFSHGGYVSDDDVDIQLDYGSRSTWTEVDTERLHRGLGLIDSEGNETPRPPTPAEAAAAVADQLPIVGSVQPTAEAQLIADVRGQLFKEGADEADVLETTALGIALSLIAEARRGGVVEQVQLVVRLAGSIDAARVAIMEEEFDG